MPRWLVILFAVAPLMSAMAGELPDSAADLLPEQWSMSTSDHTTTADWWQALGGDELSNLVTLAQGSTNAQTAVQSVAQARARGTQTASGWLPSLSAGANWQTGTSSAAFAAAGETSNFQQVTGTVDLNVPLSPWSSVPSQRAASADTRSAEASLDTAQVTATIEVTQLWLDVLFAREQLALITTQVETDASLLDLVEARYATGETTGVDVLQQRQQLASTLSSLPDAEAAVGRAERALSALLRMPVDAPIPVIATALPKVPTALPTPPPSELVPSHPRVQSALATYESSTYQRSAAQADYLPTLSATASTGMRYTELSKASTTPTWSVGLNVSVPLFDGGRTVGAVREATAAQRSALLTLEQTTLDVSREVEDALALEAQRRAEVAATDDAARFAEAALTASRAEYAAGVTTYNTVLSAVGATRTAQRSQLTAARNHLDAALDLVAMTGGVWVNSLEML